MSRVSIIIPTKNEALHIEECLKSCLKQSHKDIEIIVVDNHSTDQTRSIARKYTRRVSMKGPERSAQKNFGALKATGEYLLFLDADARLTRTVLVECVNLAKKGNSMVIIPERHIGQGFWAEVKALERSFYLGDDNIEAPWFFKREDFLAVGGYDEELFAGEDWELFDRMVASGFKCDRCEAFINHHIDKLSLTDQVKKKYYYGTNIRRLLTKDAARAIRSNPLVRPAVLKNAHYLFKSPIKYTAIFVLKFLESAAILAGMLAESRNSEWINSLKRLSGNRVLYYSARKMLADDQNALNRRQKKDLQAIVDLGEGEIQKTQRTLDFVQKNLPEAILVKTYKFWPYITHDLDLLVHDRTEAEKVLGRFTKEPHPGKQNKYQKNYYRDDLLRLDIHEDFYWQGFKFVDVGEVFKNTQQVEYLGRTVTIPNYTIEFLLNCAHILFEKRYITLLDYWYLNKLIDEKLVDWKLIKNQARKYGWWSSLQFLKTKLRQTNTLGHQETFPRFLSTTEIYRIYREKCLVERKVPLFDIFYYIFARMRGKLGIKTRYPYYLHWFDFDGLK